MKQSMILFEVRFEDQENEPYRSKHHVTVGPFRDTKEAGKFMVDNLGNEERMISAIQPNFDRKISHLMMWEVIDRIGENEALNRICSN